MRVPSDMPRRQASGRRRLILLIIAGAILVLFTLGASTAGFYTDYLWFEDLGVSSVFTGILGAKALLVIGLFLIAGLLVWANLFVADRLGRRGPERGLDEPAERYQDVIGDHTGKVRIAVAVLIGFMLSSGASTRWHDLVLFRNQVDFDKKDPQFGRDIGFYMFDLPLRTFLVSWVAWAIVASLIVSAAAHYLNGGIRVQPGAGRGVTAAAKAHLSVLAALLALVKAYGYYLDRFELLFSERGFGRGAFFTDVKARLPALNLLILISIAAAVLLVLNIWRKGAALPGVAVGSWLVVSLLVGAAYPAITQQFRVKPAESERERPYIDRNIEATRAAYGLDEVQLVNAPYTDAPGAVSPADLQAAETTIRNVRLWDPSPEIALQTFSRQQSLRDYYQVRDIDVDRYEIDGRPTQVLVGARELNSDRLPRKNWVNRHLAYTHGFGVIMAPANSSSDEGSPVYNYKDLPPTPELRQPRLYFGEAGGAGDYAIVNTKQAEIDFQRADGRDETSSYGGQRGVRLNSFVRRAAFALRFREMNVLISNFITPSSRVLYVREVQQRLEKVAPFLTYDRDPYPVVLEGRILWVADAYTTSHRYPYAQAAEGFGGASYVRNSVKAVIDAYDGTVTLYAIDTTDPLLRAYRKAFPSLFSDRSRMPAGLEAHFRYPEDLFKAQAAHLGRYHITNAPEFYSASDAWSVSPDPGIKVADAAAAPATTARAPSAPIPAPVGNMIPPTYLLQRLPGDERESFSALLPFVPFAAGDNARVQTLTAYLTARSDPGEYGRLVVYRLPSGQQINGPPLVAANIEADAVVAQQVSLLDREGSQVRFGNVLLVPIENSILYVRPLYVQAVGNAVPRLERVIIVYGNRVVINETLKGALTAMFGGSAETLEQQGPAPPSGPAPPGGGPPGTDPQELIRQADAKLNEADTALRNGDLGAYQRLVREAQDLIRRAVSSSAPTTTAPPAPTTTAAASG